MRRRDFVTASLLSLPDTAIRVRAVPPPVVLELFTSQGCSSCPPADAFLGELSRLPGIIGLAWHVDYWNSLGWRDPFARREWTDRQRTYARALGSEVYTPALVVNGAAMVVGSDRAAVHQAIDRAPPPAVAVSLYRAAAGPRADIGEAPEQATGILVSYDPEVATHVGAGENQGRRLVEYRVAREVTTIARLAPVLTLPSVADNRGAVLLIQAADGRVIGAADLTPGRNA